MIPQHIVENRAQTRDHRPVRVLCTDNKLPRPIVALVDGIPATYRSDGRYVGGESESCMDLVEIPNSQTLDLDMEQAVFLFREAEHKLSMMRLNRYNLGDPVRVDAPSYKGYGRVGYFGDGLRCDQLPVLLENGNTWYYPLETCYPAKEEDDPVLKRIPQRLSSFFGG